MVHRDRGNSNATLTPPDGPVEIFRAGWQGVKVRAVQALVLLVMVPALLYGAWVTTLDDTVSGPVRYGTAAFMLALAVAAVVGIIAYGWCYVTRAVWDAESGRCTLTLAGIGFPARLEVPAASERDAFFADGEYHNAGMTVTASWYHIRLPGRRLPLFVDVQGEMPQPALVDRVLLGGGSALGLVEAKRSRRT